MILIYYVYIYIYLLIYIIWQETDRGKRFDYLLQQTEIFAHFMSTNQKKDDSTTATSTGGTPKKAKGRPRKPKAESGDSE